MLFLVCKLPNFGPLFSLGVAHMHLFPVVCPAWAFTVAPVARRQQTWPRLFHPVQKKARSQLSMAVQDDALFQRNFQQLQVYYTDLRGALPPSELRQTLLGLNLVRLLVANRIADFHIELETLGPEDQAHPAIAFPKQLEQALMEGTYRQVVASCKSAPSPYMTPLLIQLAETVRDELAGCASAVRFFCTSPQTHTAVPRYNCACFTAVVCRPRLTVTL